MGYKLNWKIYEINFCDLLYLPYDRGGVLAQEAVKSS